MPDEVVREADIGDIDEMVRLWRLLEDAQAAHRIYPTVDDPEKRVTALLVEAIESPDARAFVLERDGRLVAMAVARLGDQGPRSLSDARIVELSRVVVDPDARGEGLGARLVREAESFGRAHGAGWLEAKMFTGNEVGRGFWDRMGFRSRFEERVRRIDGA